MTTITPKTFAQMATTTTLTGWFTVVDRNTGARVSHAGSYVAFETKEAATAYARSLGWDGYTWAPDGR